MMRRMTDRPVSPAPDAARPGAPDDVRPRWLAVVAAAAGVLVVTWVCLTEWGAVAHGHPLYGVLLALTVAASALAGWRALRARGRRRGWRRVAGGVLLVAAVVWVATMAWLRPFSAVEPALTAMVSDARVTVAESATDIVLTPSATPSATGVFFQPGARVDARAYAAILRPLAEAGYVVVIAKQPLGIAFTALPAFDAAKAQHPEIARWIVGGHSLGGTVACMQADAGDTDPQAPVVGLLLYASHPAGDISTSLHAKVMSISASHDGLATPDKIAATKPTLPPDATYVTIEGGVHAFFGDYGTQPGDGDPTITHDAARAAIDRASVDFVRTLSKT